MLKRVLQRFGLSAYRTLATSGIMSNPIARSIFLKAYGFYKAAIEAGPVDQLRVYVPPDSIVIDVGANVGFFSLKFADWVGPSGRVYAVEPDPENYVALVDALTQAELQSRVTTRRAVVAAAPGTLLLQRNEIHPGDHKIAVGAETGIEVEAVTLDGLVDDDARDRVSLIKIDVQGAEMMVLSGALKTLAMPDLALFIEVDDRALRRFDSSAHEMVDFLEGLGFRMFELVKTGAARPLDRAALNENLARKSYVDVLFCGRRQSSAKNPAPL